MKYQVTEDTSHIIPYQGNTSSYNSRMCEVVVSTARAGGQKAQMCVNCGISESTFNNYLNEYPEFKKAFEHAVLIFMADQEALLNAGARGLVKNYNFKANEKILGTLDRKYQSLTNGSNTTININTINLTPEQRNEKIKQITEKLKAFGIEYEPENSDQNTIIEANSDSSRENERST